MMRARRHRNRGVRMPAIRGSLSRLRSIRQTDLAQQTRAGIPNTRLKFLRIMQGSATKLTSCQPEFRRSCDCSTR
jgi:hypothetical protein